MWHCMESSFSSALPTVQGSSTCVEGGCLFVMGAGFLVFVRSGQIFFACAMGAVKIDSSQLQIDSQPLSAANYKLIANLSLLETSQSDYNACNTLSIYLVVGCDVS